MALILGFTCWLRKFPPGWAIRPCKSMFEPKQEYVKRDVKSLLGPSCPSGTAVSLKRPDSNVTRSRALDPNPHYARDYVLVAKP